MIFCVPQKESQTVLKTKWQLDFHFGQTIPLKLAFNYAMIS